MKIAVTSPDYANFRRGAEQSSFQNFSFQRFSFTPIPLFPRNPHFPARWSDPMALSGASRTKQTPSSQNTGGRLSMTTPTKNPFFSVRSSSLCVSVVRKTPLGDNALSKNQEALPTDRLALPKDRESLQKDRESLQKDREAVPTDREALPMDRKAFKTIFRATRSTRLACHFVLQGCRWAELPVRGSGFNRR